jgi:hypothetical protein
MKAARLSCLDRLARFGCFRFPGLCAILRALDTLAGGFRHFYGRD